MSKTLQEIKLQYGALSQTLALYADQESELRSFIQAQPTKRLLFTGCGSSFMIACSARTIASTRIAIPAYAMASGDLWLHADRYENLFEGAVGGFGIFLCRQFIEDIPDSLCEAASIDGAGAGYIYVRIILPLIKPAIGALTIFTFLGKWNDYTGPLLYISHPNNMTMPLALNYFSGQHVSDNGATMAAAVIVTLPVLFVFLLLQRQFVEGIAITGIK